MATHFVLSPEVEKFPELFKPLFFSLVWLAKRPWILDSAIVLVQALPDEVHVLLVK